MNEKHVGSCLCGGVRYAVEGALTNATACHCSQCRRTSGHFAAMTNVNVSDFTLVSSETLTWYRSSEQAERGFCRRCGGNLFWRRVADPSVMSVTAGTFDLPTGLVLDQHIFVADKGDYYDLNDGIVKYSESN